MLELFGPYTFYVYLALGLTFLVLGGIFAQSVYTLHRTRALLKWMHQMKDS